MEQIQIEEMLLLVKILQDQKQTRTLINDNDDVKQYHYKVGIKQIQFTDHGNWN